MIFFVWVLLVFILLPLGTGFLALRSGRRQGQAGAGRPRLIRPLAVLAGIDTAVALLVVALHEDLSPGQALANAAPALGLLAGALALVYGSSWAAWRWLGQFKGGRLWLGVLGVIVVLSVAIVLFLIAGAILLGAPFCGPDAYECPL